MKPKEENKEVKNPEEGGGEPSKPQENESSPEVKSEVEPEVKPEEKKPEEVEVNKDKEQISNLNTALKQEREARKKMEEKATELENQIKESSETIDRLKSVFSSEEDNSEETDTEYMTKEEADAYFEQKFEEQKKKENDEKKAEIIKKEINELEKEYDGKDGKPKYNDQEVLNWQKEQDKLYLSPREAFISMKKDEILDYEVKQRLSEKKEVKEVEKSSGGEITHEPESFVPTNETETRQAIIEAMDNLEKEI